MGPLENGKDRILFVIKATLLGTMSGAVFLLAVLLLGSVNFWQTLVINTFLFVFSVIILRCLGGVIDRIVLRIGGIIERFPRLKRFVIRYM